MMESAGLLCSYALSGPSLISRVAAALQQFCAKLSSGESGALVQVWMPDRGLDDEVVLRTTGLPFTVSGVGDLLALFRCCSCKYKFSTDVQRQDVMGAVGRVFVSGEPEYSNDVQQYDKAVYLRVLEAQRCRISSSMFMPLYDSAERNRPIAVFEACQPDKNVHFAGIVGLLVSALQRLDLYTVDTTRLTMGVGLRSHISMCVARSRTACPEGRGAGAAGGNQQVSLSHGMSQSWRLRPQPQGAQSTCHTSCVHDGHPLDGRLARDWPDVAGQGMRGPEETRGPQDDYCRPRQSDGPQQGGMRDNRASMEQEHAEARGQHTSSGPSHVDASRVGLGMSGRVVAAREGSPFGTEQRMLDQTGEERMEFNNRIGGGAGRRLTLEDLQACFGYGLRDAAARLHICPTTLKRACRRHGITRWPRRQMAKQANRERNSGHAATRASEQSNVSGESLTTGRGAQSRADGHEEAGSAMTGSAVCPVSFAQSCPLGPADGAVPLDFSRCIASAADGVLSPALHFNPHTREAAHHGLMYDTAAVHDMFPAPAGLSAFCGVPCFPRLGSLDNVHGLPGGSSNPGSLSMDEMFY